MTLRSIKTAEDRFWPKVDKSGGENACWPWIGASHPSGHGSFWLAGENINAHRFAYRVCKGAIPLGAIVRHTCDNPCCCNPEHLIHGTQADNMADKVERGRQAVGEANGNSKLTRTEVEQIRARHRRYDKENGTVHLSKEFNVTRKIIIDIVAKRIWR